MANVSNRPPIAGHMNDGLLSRHGSQGDPVQNRGGNDGEVTSGHDPANNRGDGGLTPSDDQGATGEAVRREDSAGGRNDHNDHGGGHDNGNGHGYGNNGNDHGYGNNGNGRGNDGNGGYGNGAGNNGAGNYGGPQSGLISGLGGTLGHLSSILFGNSPGENWQPHSPFSSPGETPRSGGDPTGRVLNQPGAPDPASPHAGSDRPLPPTPDGPRAPAEVPRADAQGQGQTRAGPEAGAAQSPLGQHTGTPTPTTNANANANANAGLVMTPAMAEAAMLAGTTLAAGLAEGAAAQMPQTPSASNAAHAAALASDQAILAGQNAQSAKDALAQPRTPGTADTAQLRQPANDPRAPTQLADPRRGAETLDPSQAKSTADAQARTLADPRMLDPRLADARLSQALVRADADAKQLQADAAEKAKNANLADSARAVNGDESKMRARLAFGGGTLASTAASARQALDWVGQQVREWGFDAKEGAEGVRAMRVVAGLIAASVIVLVVIALMYALRVILLT